MTKYTDEDVLKGFENQYNNILNKKDPRLCELDEAINNINFQIFQLIRLKQSELEERQKYIRDRWYRYHLHKRILKIFNIKNIFRSKKANEYYLKYVNKRHKFQALSLDFDLDQFKSMLELGIKRNLCSNSTKASAYSIVLMDLFGRKDEFHEDCR